MNIKALLNERFAAALIAVDAAGPAVIQVAGRPEFGDYQMNGCMAAAKRRKQNPRELAAAVIEAVDLDGIAASLEIAGPGFINIRLADDFLTRTLNGPLEITAAAQVQRIVVDYSAPNLAKEMHVGHLRSTIIGDAMVRVLEALGHSVIRQNHVGDWGTQFGMLLAYLEENGEDSDELANLEVFYRAAKARFDADAEFAERARAMVVALQGGDAEANVIWQRFIKISLAHCQAIYDRLGVSLSNDDVMAESGYNDMLADIVADLEAQGLLQESDGARCAFLPQFTGKDGSITPIIVQKSDGGYLYATTDLAAVRYRAETLKVDRSLYFVDARQSMHFKQIFALAEKAGFFRRLTSF